MICYKDRWFCESYKTCKFRDKCNRALTPKVQKEADKWWNQKSTTPIDSRIKPECYESK